MKTAFNRRKKLVLFGLICAAIAITELFYCFNGPFAFVHKPSLIIYPPFQSRMSEDETKELTSFLERQIALNNSYSITEYRTIEEHFIRNNPDSSAYKITAETDDEARLIAAEMGLERFGTVSVWENPVYISVTVRIKDVRDGKSLKTHTFKSSSLRDFLAGNDQDGEPLNVQEAMLNVTKGVGFTDYLVLGLLGLLFLTGVISLTGREPGILIEVLLAPALILFLFAFIHARSANMDYVQRYIASGGQLRLAKNTALAQLYAALRFGPIITVGGFYYTARRLTGIRVISGPLKSSLLKRIIEPWALLWVLLSGLLFTLSFPSFLTLEGLAPLAWISLVPLFLVLISEPYPRAVFYGVIFGMIQALLINYWLGTYKYITLHLVTIIQFGQYLIFMLPLAALIKISRRWGFLTAAVGWTIFDYIRSVGTFGYPWALIGTTQYRFIPFIQTGSVSGVWGIGFVILLCNTAIAWCIAAAAMRWNWPEVPVPGIRGRLRISFPLAVFIGVFIISLTTGGILLAELRYRMRNAPEHAKILLLQQNTDPRKREYKENTDKLREITDKALKEMDVKPDLIAWPEGGFRLDIRYWTQEGKQNSRWGKVTQEFLDYQKNLGIWLASGTKDHKFFEVEGEDTAERVNYNSSVFIDDSGNIVDFYHKIRLVPFSEHFPLDKEKFQWLDSVFEKYNISNWGTGDERKIFSHDKMNVITPICFEDVFSDHVRRYVQNDVDVILNMSNDYWSLSPVEGRQHGILSLFRAIENQRPILRTSSSGYTVYIDAAGKIQPGAPEPYTEGWVLADVPLIEKKLTFYTRYGDWFPKLCIILLLLSLAAAGIKQAVRRTGKRTENETELKVINDG